MGALHYNCRILLIDNPDQRGLGGYAGYSVSFPEIREVGVVTQGVGDGLIDTRPVVEVQQTGD
jgi:hypothetical protein